MKDYIIFIVIVIVIISLFWYFLFIPHGYYDARYIPRSFYWKYSIENQFWKRPDIPPTVALQIGHQDIRNIPEELQALRKDTGGQYQEVKEVDINKKIAELTTKELEKNGIKVILVPATVPHDLYADAFVAIHADVNDDNQMKGYKSSIPWHDLTGKAAALKKDIDTAYFSQTHLENDEKHTTINMRSYYPFSWWRFMHAVSPHTPAIIVETGYISNEDDRKIIVDHPETSAHAIAIGIEKFMKENK